MKAKTFILFATLVGFFLISCESSKDSNVISQRYIHKYGFDITKKEWDSRQGEGQIVTLAKNGVTVAQAYSDNVLHGTTTYTFPHSKIIHKTHVYEDGNLIKKVTNDKFGIPLFEESTEYDNRMVLTYWDEKGVPQRKEEYLNKLLISGDYFKPNNEKEAKIEEGSGYRILRTRQGKLLHKDLFEGGKLVTRISYHDNGQIQSKTSYKNYTLHGDQKKYAPNGNLVLDQTWDDGKINGYMYQYHNNLKIAEVYYDMGKKDGIEKHWTKDGSLTTEIHWEKGQKHGSDRFFSDEDTQINWYFRGKNVSPQTFQLKVYEEKLMAQIKDNNTNYPLEVADLSLMDEDSTFDDLPQADRQ
jgi:antitoxin component YwqK of YwqJK toxin-antitoxin module